MGEIAKREDTGQVIPQSPDTIMAVISRAAADEKTDVVKLEKLTELYERIMDRQAKAEFASAMARVQEKLPIVTRDAINQQTNSRYAKLERIAKVIKPIYTAEGFATSFTEGESAKDGHIRICGTLMHRAGHERTGYYADVPLDDVGLKGNPNKTKTHATGSTLSYGRRYLTCMMFDVATGDDDDGNSASVPRITEKQAADLQALIDEVGANKVKFLKYFKIEQIEDLAAGAYKNAVQALEEYRKK